VVLEPMDLMLLVDIVVPAMVLPTPAVVEAVEDQAAAVAPMAAMAAQGK